MTTIISTVMALTICITSVFAGPLNATNIPQDETNLIIVEKDNHAFVDYDVQIENYKDQDPNEQDEECFVENRFPIYLRRPHIDIILPPRLIKKPGIVLPIPVPPRFPRYPMFPKGVEVPNEKMISVPYIEKNFKKISIN